MRQRYVQQSKRTSYQCYAPAKVLRGQVGGIYGRFDRCGSVRTKVQNIKLLLRLNFSTQFLSLRSLILSPDSIVVLASTDSRLPPPHLAPSNFCVIFRAKRQMVGKVYVITDGASGAGGAICV